MEKFQTRNNHKKPDVVGITMMSPDYDYAIKCIDIVKGVNKHIKTVVGGFTIQA